MNSKRRSEWSPAGPRLMPFLLGCILLLVVCATAVATPARSRSHQPMATIAQTLPRPLSVAAKLSSRADRRFVNAAKSLNSCLAANRRSPRHCSAERAAVQRAGIRLAHAQGLLARVARKRKGASKADSSLRVAPSLHVAGHRLFWTGRGRVGTYVLSRKTPGQPAQYSVLTTTSTVPPPVPGVSVVYSVRTTVSGSSWSPPVTISYPAPETLDSQAAPALHVSGQTLTWNAIAGVSTYVLVSRVSGQPDQYSAVSGTSVTPAAVGGATVHYSVRTAVPGSAWAVEVSISYPASPPPPPPPPPPPVEPPSTGFEPGINAGRIYPGQVDLSGATQLGAKLVRVEFPIEWTAAQLEQTIAGYANAGIKVAPLATFRGRMPSPAEAQNLASWAKAYGPGGTFWSTHNQGQLAIQTIEFGNETDGGYQYGDGAGAPSYTARAEAYATRLKEAAVAISATGVKVGMLSVSEDWTGDWMNGMFAAVPNLGSYVAGWVSHPYGPSWKTAFENIVHQTAAHGAPSSIPIDVTEWGVSSDNGRCLGDNYGWNPCMTYQQAAETLRGVTGEMHHMLGSRLGMFMVYQIRDQQNSGTTAERESYFGIMQHEQQAKGAYTEAAKELLAS